ncbi:unnamed protein product, partial [marine sediment metagenome]
MIYISVITGLDPGSMTLRALYWEKLVRCAWA